MTDEEPVGDSNTARADSSPDASSDAKTVQSDWTTSEQPSAAIIDCIAAASDRSPLDMTPLHEYVDPEALDAIVTSAKSASQSEFRVSFRYEELDVSVEANGTVTVTVERED
ncbi:MAG: HalOD1 output domain-containing protein [Halobacteriota archaeon]